MRVRVGGALPRRRSPSPSLSESLDTTQSVQQPVVSRPVMKVVKKIPQPAPTPAKSPPMSVTIGAGSPAPKPVIDGVELGNTTDSSVDALTPKSSVVEKANAFLERSPRLSLDSSMDDDTTVTPSSARRPSRRLSKQTSKPAVSLPTVAAPPTKKEFKIGASAALADALKAEKSRGDALEVEKRSLQSRVASLEAEAESLKTQSSGVHQDHQAARQEAARLAGLVASLQTEKATSDRALADMRAQAGGAHARHTEAEAALEELREIKTQLEVENASLRRRGLDLGDADERHRRAEKSLREAELAASKAKNEAHHHMRSLKSVESERDALRATLKKAADDTAQARAELEAVRHLGAESKLAGDAALRELERLRDERARRHAREHDHAMAAGLARSELDAARARSAEASRRALEAESKLADLEHEHESSLRDLKAQCDRYQRERDVAREDAQHALDREEAGRAERHSLEEALRDATAQANALKRQIGVASAPAEHAKLQAERALERARSDRDAAKAELESLKRVHAANVDAIKAEAEVEVRQIATAAAAEADEDWSRRLAEAVRDVRDRCIQRDRDQADEIASLRQALSDVETRYAEQLNRERSALLQARAEADSLRRSSVPQQPTSIYRDLPPPPPVQSVGLGELASRLQAMQAAFRAQAYSVPAINVEPPRQRPRAGLSVGVAALVAADRNLPPPTLERAPSVSGTAAVADAATAPAPFTDDDRTVASAFDNTSQLTEGPGFHRGYWQRAYGEALPTPGSLVA